MTTRGYYHITADLLFEANSSNCPQETETKPQPQLGTNVKPRQTRYLISENCTEIVTVFPKQSSR
jgi:hypothetical protein